MPILTQHLSMLHPRIHVGARTTLRVLSAQRPDKPTYEQGGRTNTASPDAYRTPGHRPHGDGPQPCPMLKPFQKRRCPAVDPAAHPHVLEVVLGQSAADKYIQATNWVHKWQQNSV
jgi:hypothetical protein